MVKANPLQLGKKGIRVLAIAESFKMSSKFAVLAGVVMRRDLIIDGVGFTKSTLKGNDSTQNIISMFQRMQRNDVNCIFIGGAIISLYNIIDANKIHQSTGIPVIAITFRNSEGIANTIKKAFKNDWQVKLEQYHNLGERQQVNLKTGKSVFIRHLGLSLSNSIVMLNHFTHQGSIPEPVRIARLIARAYVNKS
jgi:endonuclease V-like protein UPF0215 family